MEVILTSGLEAFIQEEVRSGLYLDASDVVRDALRVMERKEVESPELEAALLEGMEGKPVDYGPQIWEQIRAAAREKSAA